MNIRYRVELSEAERTELQVMLSNDRHAVRRGRRAQILLAIDAGQSNEAIAGLMARKDRSPPCTRCAPIRMSPVILMRLLLLGNVSPPTALGHTCARHHRVRCALRSGPILGWRLQFLRLGMLEAA